MTSKLTARCRECQITIANDIVNRVGSPKDCWTPLGTCLETSTVAFRPGYPDCELIFKSEGRPSPREWASRWLSLFLKPCSQLQLPPASL